MGGSNTFIKDYFFFSLHPSIHPSINIFPTCLSSHLFPFPPLSPFLIPSPTFFFSPLARRAENQGGFVELYVREFYRMGGERMDFSNIKNQKNQSYPLPSLPHPPFLLLPPPYHSYSPYPSQEYIPRIQNPLKPLEIVETPHREFER